MKRVLALAALSASVFQVYSDDSLSTFSSRPDTTLYIKEVVVNSKTAFKDSSPSQKFNSDQLERLGSESVADALRHFSGLQIKDYGGVGGIKTVNIRSLGSQHLGISYDGIQLGNAQNGQIDLGQFSLDNVDEVSLFNGQKSSIFLSASDFSNAGAVFIRTRRSRLSKTDPFNLRFKAKVASYDTYHLSALYEQRLSETLCTSFNAEAITSTGKYKFRYSGAGYDTTAIRKNGDIKSLRAEGNIYMNTQNSTTGSLKIYTYHSERGIPGAIASNVWARGERQWDHNTFIQGHIQKGIGSRFNTRLLAKYAYYDTRYVNNDTTRMLIDNNYKHHELYLSTANVYEILSNWNISLSYDFKWNKLDSDIHNFAFPSRYSSFISLASALDFNKLKIQGSLLGTFINDKTDIGSASEHTSALTPAIFINWTPFNDIPISLRAFAKKSFRMPTFNDLYYVDIGNAKLEPESAIQYNIGATFEKQNINRLFSSFKVQADAYYNTVDDKIVAYPKGTQFRWTMLNLGKVHIHGVDVTAETSIVPTRNISIYARIQYTYQKALDVTDANTSYYKDQLPYTPRHSGSGILAVRYRNSELSISSIYSGKRYSQQENTERNELPAWQTCDLALSHTIRISRSIMRIRAEVNNIFNKEYDVVRNFPMPLRNYSIGINYEL